MLYSSVDMESTGLVPGVNQMIQLAIVLDDLANPQPFEKLPKFKCYIAHKEYNISAGLAALNDQFHTLEMIQKISKVQQTKEFKKNGIAFDGENELYVSPTELGGVLFNFFQKNNYPHIDKNGRFVITPAGKNVGGFDIPFIKATIPDWENFFSFSHRSIDPAILFLDPVTDQEVPNLSACKQRAGLDSVVTHDAYDDCLDIVKLIRFHFKMEYVK